MKVALFGGSFNPIHNGHLGIAEEAISKNLVDEVWFIPCGNHPFDKELIDGDIRVKMIYSAIKHNKNMKVISVEMNPEKKSYSYKTISWFKKEFEHDFYFIIGADNLDRINEWKDFEKIRDNTNFIVATRRNNKIENKNNLKISHVISVNLPFSSTEIREKIRKGEDFIKFLPEEVYNHITSGRLYK